MESRTKDDTPSGWLEALEARERLARAGKWQRMASIPYRYLRAMTFNHLVYPWRSRGWRTSARTFMGSRMQLILPAATDIYLLGIKTHSSEIRLTRFLLKYLQPGATAADVGAHFGYFTQIMAEVTGAAGAVHAFEASGSTSQVLRTNTSAYPQVKPRHLAASDAPGNLEFYEFPVLYSEFNTLDPQSFADSPWYGSVEPRKVIVEAVTLDAYFAKEGTTPAVVKIDVEGAEERVVAGMKQLLQQSSPMVVMEYWGPERPHLGHRKATEVFISLGYVPHFLNESGDPVLCENPDTYLSSLEEESDNLVFLKTSLPA